MSVVPPVSYGRKLLHVPGAFSEDMRSCLQGSAVAARAFSGVVREEASPVFTRGGVIGDDVGYAAQMASFFPFGETVEKVARVFGERRFEAFLFSADREPLGPPVRMIAKAALPL